MDMKGTPTSGSQPLSRDPIESSSDTLLLALSALPVSNPLIWEEYAMGELQLKASPQLKLQWDMDASRFPVQRFFKRILDVVLAGTALLVLSPVLSLMCALIAWESPGHPIFTQTRVGRGGRLFKLYKLRTMVSDAEQLKDQLLAQNELDGPVFKMKHDPRVTKLGRFLRKSSLDELPQLWNVIKGDMSLVGPRPALPHEAVQWEEWQAERLGVEQGCTCIWQVSGRNHIGFDDWMQMDVAYVRQWNLRLDFILIFKTIWVMVTGRGAY